MINPTETKRNGDLIIYIQTTNTHASIIYNNTPNSSLSFNAIVRIPLSPRPNFFSSKIQQIFPTISRLVVILNEWYNLSKSTWSIKNFKNLQFSHHSNFPLKGHFRHLSPVASCNLWMTFVINEFYLLLRD